MIQDYISYLTHTLGIKQVILPPMAEPIVLSKVLFIDEKPWSKEATLLFRKMEAAMKLDPSQVTVIFESEVSAPELQLQALTYPAVVFFSEKNFDKIEASQKFMTSSPEQMLKHPELKKEAWAILQKVMSSIS